MVVYFLEQVGLIAYAVLLILFPVGIYFGVKADPLLEDKAFVALFFIILTIVGIQLLIGIKKRKVDFAIHSLLTGWIAMIILFFHFAYPPIDAEILWPEHEI